MQRMRPTRAAALAMVALALLASGCSSSSGGNSGTHSGGTTLGASPKPTGAPILLGMANEENVAAGSYPEVRLAAEAAVEYVNNNLGGVNGRPLKLVTCITDATPATSAGCANEFAADKVAAVAAGVDFGSSGSMPILSKAGIPVLGGTPTQAADYITPGVYTFNGGTAAGTAGVMAWLANDLHVQKVAIIYIDIPAGAEAATEFGRKVLNRLGVTDVTMVPAAATLTDYTAPVEQAIASHPDAIYVLDNTAACSEIMQARYQLGVRVPMAYVGSCAAHSVLAGGGAGADGAYFESDATPLSSDDPQVAVFKQAMKSYQPGTVLSTFSEMGFQDIMNIYELLKKLPGSSITPSGILKAVRQTKDEPDFLGYPYTCNGKQVPGFSAPCSSSIRIVQYKGGKLVDVLGKWISGAQYLG